MTGDRLPRLDRATAEIRNAVRVMLAEAPETTKVTEAPETTTATEAPEASESTATPDAHEYILAVSGGADSMALAAACAHLGGARPAQTATGEARAPYAGGLRSTALPASDDAAPAGAATTARSAASPATARSSAAPATPRFHAVVVDHGLQPESAATAAEVVERLRALGLGAESVRVEVPTACGGIEAAARTARYAALERIRADRAATAILTGHTSDDQAETVLLGLVRGSGARSLAGMRPRTGRVWRPLLPITREQTSAACRAAGIAVWEDPMNADPRFARVRARTRVLPVLESELGPGVARALARTAALLAADSDALEDLAATALAAHTSGPEVSAAARDLAPAVRTRALRDWLRAQAGTAQEVGARHVGEVDDLLCGRRSGAVSVPGDAAVVATSGGGVRFRRNGPDSGS